jgi:hypothetical protein
LGESRVLVTEAQIFGSTTCLCEGSCSSQASEKASPPLRSIVNPVALQVCFLTVNTFVSVTLVAFIALCKLRTPCPSMRCKVQCRERVVNPRVDVSGYEKTRWLVAPYFMLPHLRRITGWRGSILSCSEYINDKNSMTRQQGSNRIEARLPEHATADPFVQELKQC